MGTGKARDDVEPANAGYDDRVILTGHVGFPEVRSFGPEGFIVSTWTGRCCLVNTATWSVQQGPNAGNEQLQVGYSLRSLSVSTAGRVASAVAARAGWACVWIDGESENRYIWPTVHGPVNAVALSPRGDRLAIGTGYYSLSSFVPRAHVELWTVGEAPRCIASRRLPGVVVDRAAWDEKGARLIAVSGAYTQDRGHLVVLDGNDLQILDIAETYDRDCADVWLDATADMVITAYSQAAVVRRLSDFVAIDCRWDFEEPAHGADYWPTSQHLLLSNGLLIDLASGDRLQLPPLPLCTGVAFLSECVAVGISSEGVLRKWQWR